jgi:N-acetylglucosaminyldiphosphoundecaprenol N-acetyl-beta-D-mannosaminyltransferase
VPFSANPRLQVGRLQIDAVTFAEAIEAIAALVGEGRGGMVLTPNVDHVVLAEENESFRQAYEAASLSLVDGMPLLWASRLLGVPLPEKISGSDLVWPLLHRAERDGWRVFLLGGAPGVAQRAAKRVVDRFPRLAIAGVAAPEIDVANPVGDDDTVVREIRESKADLVLVALGAPKQEIWMSRASPAVGRAVMIGVGASIDFLAGAVRRAPKWVSASGLEWLFRLALEPNRLWRRYLLRDPKFLFILLRDLSTGRRA